MMPKHAEKTDEIPGTGATTFASDVQGSVLGASAIGPNASATGIVNVHYHRGLSFTEAERLFGLLFEQNFPRLVESATTEARRRVDEFATAFTRVAATQHVTEEQLRVLGEPDVQFVLNEATQAAARRDSEELRGTLAHLIVKRLQSGGSEAKEQLLGEAIVVVGKLTATQLRTIVLCFLMRNATWELRSQTWTAFNEFMNGTVDPFLKRVNPSNVDLERIVSLGCGETASDVPTLDAIWVKKLRKLLPRDALEPGATAVGGSLVHRNSITGGKLIAAWEHLRLDLLRLTKLGVVIGATTCEQGVGRPFPLDTWIQETPL